MTKKSRKALAWAAAGLALAFGRSARSTEDILLTVATQNYGHTRALLEGAVGAPGCTIRYSTMSLSDLNEHAFNDKLFDVTEVELLPFLAKGGLAKDSEYVLLPVFPLRDFQLRNIWIRADRNILGPQDLRGKTVAVAGYGSTEAAWIRGYLQSTAAIQSGDIEWIDARNIPKTQTWDLLLGGKAAAALDIHLPPAGVQGIARLFPDYKKAEQEEFAATRIFPIVTVLAVRRKMVEENPWLAEALFIAFCEAKSRAIANLETENEPKIPLPWGSDSLAETLDLMGKNFWSYGIPNNPKSLKAVLQFAGENGSIAADSNPEALFYPSTAQLVDK